MFLTLTSGNTWFKIHGEYIYVGVSGLIILYLLMHKEYARHYAKIAWYCFIMLSIFMIQYLIFGWNTLPGIVNFISKIIFGGFIFTTIGYRFKFVYLKVMYHLSIIALIFWSIQRTTGIIFDWVNVGNVGKSIFLYFTRHNEPIRNCGPFWEPGAYGCYIMLVAILFTNQIPFLWKKYKKECIILILALLSTQSTTAYIAFGFFLISYFGFIVKSKMKYILTPIFIIGCLYFYYETSFLSNKIDTQSQNAIDAKGDFNSTRMGSFLFDMHYFLKHPLVGNGLHEKTRYSEHLYLVKLWNDGDLAKSGNGFSDYLAKMGIIFYISFAFFFYINNREITYREYILLIPTFIILLIGEPLLNYPLVLSLPFISISQCKINKDSNVVRIRYKNLTN